MTTRYDHAQTKLQPSMTSFMIIHRDLPLHNLPVEKKKLTGYRTSILLINKGNIFAAKRRSRLFQCANL